MSWRLSNELKNPSAVAIKLFTMVNNITVSQDSAFVIGQFHRSLIFACKFCYKNVNCLHNKTLYIRMQSMVS
jgi:hypothetical protein